MKIDGVKGSTRSDADAAFDFAIPTGQTPDQTMTMTAIALAESNMSPWTVTHGGNHFADASFEPTAPIHDSSAVATLHNLEFDLGL